MGVFFNFGKVPPNGFGSPRFEVDAPRPQDRNVNKVGDTSTSWTVTLKRIKPKRKTWRTEREPPADPWPGALSSGEWLTRFRQRK
jgi:hypothetical protein